MKITTYAQIMLIISAHKTLLKMTEELTYSYTDLVLSLNAHLKLDLSLMALNAVR
jgi:hypothetical protein